MTGDFFLDVRRRQMGQHSSQQCYRNDGKAWYQPFNAEHKDVAQWAL
jgi:hypothetical protein